MHITLNPKQYYLWMKVKQLLDKSAAQGSVRPLRFCINIGGVCLALSMAEREGEGARGRGRKIYKRWMGDGRWLGGRRMGVGQE